MTAYYNEIDPAAAHIIRAMIDENVIAPGHVDTRSIKDVMPDDLIGFTQCHFFAGGGLWSVAARLAGWPDDEPIWTGSCPCQPFSAAGKGGGTDDPRHLWPDLYRLIRARRPIVIMGEQVAGAAGYDWFDGVSADLEAEAYAGRSVDFPACSVDAPHQRNRQYWIAVADAISSECERGPVVEERGSEGRNASVGAHAGVGSSHLVDAPSIGRREGKSEPDILGRRPTIASTDASSVVAGGEGERGQARPRDRRGDTQYAEPQLRDGTGVTLGDAFGKGLERQPWHGDERGRPEQDRPVATTDGSRATSNMASNYGVEWRKQRELSSDSATRPRQEHRGRDGRNGSDWAGAEWIICHDGKARRTKPGLRLLAHGVSGRVDLWRVGGNAIVPQAAAEVISAFIDVYGLPSAWSAAA